ncbi:hypothetical protein Hdeb2414_s0018g00518321 [Helianthus debilis subsp. tardiflorus]
MILKKIKAHSLHISLAKCAWSGSKLLRDKLGTSKMGCLDKVSIVFRFKWVVLVKKYIGIGWFRAILS